MTIEDRILRAVDRAERSGKIVREIVMPRRDWLAYQRIAAENLSRSTHTVRSSRATTTHFPAPRKPARRAGYTHMRIRAGNVKTLRVVAA